ncbi:MAG: type I restriction-modification system endonuclease, partial [Dehalococcoidia bacterium]
ANAFKDTRMENLQTFADTFGIKELQDQIPESDTTVHIATVQGMVKRILYPSEDAPAVPVDRYDCIVVDECHRGYLLDRELSDTEMQFRGFEDYVSKYRRVIEHFDAVKIGLTATPALHTTEIFGPPVFTYSYREAVIDGFLVDHEPPIQIETELSATGITWQLGDEVKAYDPVANQLELFNAPDEIRMEVDDFNRKVITEQFNKVVCDHLATEIDPEQPAKTLIFCVNDAHADLVVNLLKQAFAAKYGSIDDDAVMKITGAADKPLQLIRRYKNERNPNIAVTVDLLTTGIDVPAISNLVFLRRVNSRILFDQMLGRATRLCDEIGKEAFRIFDAVKMYEAIHGLTAMQPVVVDPHVSFEQLISEMASATEDDERELILEQFVAKLQRKKARLKDDARADFEAIVGETPNEFIQRLREMTLTEVADWFVADPGLGELLDRVSGGPKARVLVSEHPDQLRSVERGYGLADKPGDYLDEFTRFIKEHINDIPALLTVTTRPRELTRKQLRELAIALDKAGFSESSLGTAWRETTNKEIAARIVGFVRQAALGDPLIPYEQRVDRALDRILASQSWTTPQRDWLKKIAAQTKANTLVDKDAISDPSLLVWHQGGGFDRIDRVFEGQLQAVLDNFNDYIWEPVA